MNALDRAAWLAQRRNGIKSDNRPANLLICSHEYHVALHHKLEASPVWPEFQPVTRNVKGNRHA